MALDGKFMLRWWRSPYRRWTTKRTKMRTLLLLASASVSFAFAEPVTFLRDVAPILNKMSCTSGTCHGAAKGKAGFKLSLRGYDPQFDYEALLYDLSGRRFNRADPARSLMLTKPTEQVAHGGGLRIEPGSHYYNMILSWISAGVPFGDAAADRVEKLEVLPNEVFMHGPDKTQPMIALAHYQDGTVRDVTAEVNISINTPEIADVDANARVKG